MCLVATIYPESLKPPVLSDVKRLYALSEVFQTHYTMKKVFLFVAALCVMSVSAQENGTSTGDSLKLKADTTGVMPMGGGPGGGPGGMMPMGGGPGGGPGGMMPMGGGPGGGPGGMMPGGGPGGRASAESKVSETGYGQTSGDETLSNKQYTSSQADENAVQVKGGSLVLTDCTILKPGADSDNGDGTSFYGTNAAVLVRDSGLVTLEGGSISTEAVGSNAIVACGGKAVVKNMTITCSKNLSRGIHATCGGEINAENLTIETKGNNSSVIATDRGGGVVNVKGGKYTAAGRDCAVCYSTGTITVTDIEGASAVGEIGVIEGDNEINIINSRMQSGDNRRGMMILQSGSGDAIGFNGRINVTGGSLTLTSSEAPLIEITTNTHGTVTLCDVELNIPSGVLMQVGYNSRWQTKNPVAVLNLTTDSNATYEGDVVIKDDGTATINIGENVEWKGACDKANVGLKSEVVVNGTWTLTADSYVDTLTVGEGGTVNRNGYTLTTGQNS